jgi:hypothetical protein
LLLCESFGRNQLQCHKPMPPVSASIPVNPRVTPIILMHVVKGTSWELKRSVLLFSRDKAEFEVLVHQKSVLKWWQEIEMPPYRCETYVNASNRFNWPAYSLFDVSASGTGWTLCISPSFCFVLSKSQHAQFWSLGLTTAVGQLENLSHHGMLTHDLINEFSPF